MSIIDYRHTFWGHNHHLKENGRGIFAGPCWHRTVIRKGDTVLWNTAYGHCEAEVLEVEWPGDPSDMYRIKARVVKRVADPNIVSQEELDRAFGV